jgi:hypothetical protein
MADKLGRIVASFLFFIIGSQVLVFTGVGAVFFVMWEVKPIPWELVRTFFIIGLGLWLYYVLDVIRGRI